MPKDILTIEIKRIPLEIEDSGLGMIELTDLASQVERFMLQLQEDGEIDTLKQALKAALFFAAQAYLNSQSAGGKKKEEDARLDSLITKLTHELETPHK